MSLPVTLHVAGRCALVAGGGKVAARKAAALAEAGVRLRVVAPAANAEVRGLIAGHGGELIVRPFEPDDLDGVFLAIAATNDDATNAQVVACARERGVLVCDASDGDRGDLAMPACVRVGDLTFTVDTTGAAPAFSKRIAAELRERFGADYAAALRVLRRMRTYVHTTVPETQRAEVLRALAQLPVERLASMNAVQIEHEVEAAVEHLRGAAQPTTSVVCASRASPLAMVQSREVAAKLALRGIATAILAVKTTGDKLADRSLLEFGSQSIFVTELETALREGRARYAVHSCKDLPSALSADMRLAAISAREDPRDVFCSERFPNFAGLPVGARVGTSSPRRKAQLAASRPDLTYADVRGNVGTRLRKLRDGEYDALVLAAAGMKRLGVAPAHAVPFSIVDLTPAAGQGALAVETLAGDDDFAAEVRAAINDADAELAILCERAALRSLQGGCQAPIGIFASFKRGTLIARGVVARPDGSRTIRREVTGPAETFAQAEELGDSLARGLLEDGARDLMPRDLPLAGRIVVLPRTQARVSRIATALRADGAEVLEMRSGEGEPQSLAGREPDMIVFPSSGSVVAAAGYLRRLHRDRRRPAVAVMGPATSAAAHAAGFTPDVTAPEAQTDALVAAVRAHLASAE